MQLAEESLPGNCLQFTGQVHDHHSKKHDSRQAGKNGAEMVADTSDLIHKQETERAN